MKRILLIVMGIVGLIMTPLSVQKAYGFGGCEQDCQKCHRLELSEAQEILTKLKAPEAKAIDVKMSPIRGLWEVTVENGGKKGIMYVGFSKQYVMAGTVIEVDTASNKTHESVARLNQPPDRYVDVSKVPAEGSLLLGDAGAAHKVVVFTDPDCPYCARLHAELKKIVAERKDIAFELKLFPLAMHKNAYAKAKAILCAHSLSLLEDNFEGKPIPAASCDTREVDKNLELGSQLGVTGTPTLIMPDGFVSVGGGNATALTELILNHAEKRDRR
jgi:thiol:disulfide interchange protein DsbC